MFELARFKSVAQIGPPQLTGMVTQVLGLLLEGTAKEAAVGDLYTVQGRDGELQAEVVALRGERALLLPFGESKGLMVGASLTPARHALRAAAGPALLGRVIDALGRPMDRGGPLDDLTLIPLYRPAVGALDRRPITERMVTGVRALDTIIPCGVGQRLGIFAGPGVGKSTLLGMLARQSDADVVVLALVGERGREVGHFVDSVLGPEGLKKSVVIAATSDRGASERIRAAFLATAIAEYFRDTGKRVLLVVDSLTRLCMAQREVGLAVGEAPTSKGYPPSAFAQLPKLLERVASVRNGGSMTAFYAVLVEGDDMNEPVADAARGLLDGHIVLSRSLAIRGHFPAIDVPHSLSRLDGDLLPVDELRAARTVRAWMSTLEEARELLAIGAYRPGSDPDLDKALSKSPDINRFLQQDVREATPLSASIQQIRALTHG
jgi:flagellum-specific ATP synthase